MDSDTDTYSQYEPLSRRAASSMDDLKTDKDMALHCCAGLLKLLHTSSADLDVFLTDAGPRATIKRTDGKYHISVQEMGS